MADNEVVIDIVARLDGIEGSLKKLEGQAKDSGAKVGSLLSKGLAVGAAAAAAGIAALGFALSKGIDEAIESENAISEMNNALARTGQYSKEAAADMQAFADSVQTASIYEDDVILSNAALIQSLGKLSTEGLKQATQASVDLAAAMNIDLRTASMAVGKAAAGEVGSLSRYGIQIKEGATNAETFSNALRALSGLQGAAAAAANTYGGRLEQNKNAFSGLLGEIGKIITQSPGLTAALKSTGEVMQNITKAIIDFRKSGTFEKILEYTVALGRVLNVAIVGPLEAIYNLARIVFNVLRTSLQAILVQFADAALGIVSVISLFTNKLDGLKQSLSTFADSTKETFVDFAADTGAAVKDTFDFSGTQAADGFLTGLQDSIKNAPPLGEELKNGSGGLQEQVDTLYDLSWDGLKQSFMDSVAQMKQAASALVVQLRGTIVSGVGGAFQAMGSALVKGENAFAAFGKAILGMFGDLAIQLGQFYLLLGLGNLFINPGAAAGQLAAGAALLVLGGALKALSGGGGGAAAPATGGGSASAPGGETTLSSNLQGEDAGPRTEVNVNVAGNILDRRETGLEIADIINETFSTNGLVMAKGAIV